jgi:CheY-like chemotaxis protein
VTFARNGAWGVKEAMKNNFDLFIIDMVMPAMTGEEMVTKLKMEDATKNIPIIILSASVEDDAIKRVEELGVQAFFTKTQITPSKLSNKVQEIFEQPASFAMHSII